MTDDVLAERVLDLDAQVRGLSSTVAELAAAPSVAGPALPPDPPPLDPATIDLAALDEWVRGFLLRTVARQPGSASPWCASWWRHPEAVLRLEGLRRAWYALAGQAGIGLSVWWRDHLDPCLAALTGPDGTFSLCRVIEGHQHRALDPLPAEPLPEEDS